LIISQNWISGGKKNSGRAYVRGRVRKRKKKVVLTRKERESKKCEKKKNDTKKRRDSKTWTEKFGWTLISFIIVTSVAFGFRTRPSLPHIVTTLPRDATPPPFAASELEKEGSACVKVIQIIFFITHFGDFKSDSTEEKKKKEIAFIKNKYKKKA
jgi:hypothetical protein